VDRISEQLAAIDRRISSGTIAASTRVDRFGGETSVPGYLTSDAQAAQAERVGLEAQFEIALKRQEVILQERANADAELAERLKKRNDEAIHKAEDAAEKRAEQFNTLITSLDDRGLDPLAKLIDGAQRRLAEITEKYGPLTGKNGQDLERFNSALSIAIDAEVERERQPLMKLLDQRFFPKGSPFYVPDYADRLHLPLTLQGPGLADEIAPDPNKSKKVVDDVLNRSVAGIQREAQYQEQITRLVAGPGGQLDAINKIAELRTTAAEREFAITKDKARYEAEMDQVRYDRTTQILELQKQQLEKYKDEARGVYRALTQGGSGGLDAFVNGQKNQLFEQLFVNVSGKAFQQFGGALGSLGKSSGLPGWLLEGTMFDPQNKDISAATVENSTATRENTVANRESAAAVNNLVSTLGGTPAAGGGGGVVGSTVSAVKSVFGAFGSGGGNPIADLPISDSGLRMDGNHQAGYATQKSGSGLRTGVGFATALAAGGFGIYSGIEEGGARGGVTAGASAAGMTSALLTLAGVSGPAAPIFAAAALGLGFAHSMFGDPKKQRDEQLTRMLNDSAYQAPETTSNTYDIWGGDTSYDYTGRMRGAVVVNQTIHAMDAKGFMEQAPRIAAAVQRALQVGHPLGLEIKESIGMNT
jgi:hypothetical protein